MNLEIETERLASGKYRVHRSDGRVFVILRGRYEWVVEAQDTFAVTGASTLHVAKSTIRHGWDKATKELKQ